MKAMGHVRASMRHDNLPNLRRHVENIHVRKSEQNLTKAIDQETEDLLITARQQKFAKIEGVNAYTVFSEKPPSAGD
jgi:hypothetical protein